MQSILYARAMRAAGQHDLAATAERDAAARAAALMLTPDTRRHAPNGKPRHPAPGTNTGLIEASGSSVSMVEVA